MSRCPRLRSLSFVLTSHFDITSVGQLPFVDHHLLQTLHLSGGGTALPTLLERISVPQLKGLELVTEMGDSWVVAPRRDSFSEPSLIRFLTTVPLLESLSLTTGHISLVSFTEILLHLPLSLQHLHINADKHASRYYPESPVDFLASLVVPGSTIPLPLLRDFDIAVDGEEDISDETLLQFIIARASTLKRVKINFKRRMDFNIHDALSSLIENGLDFAVTYTTPKIHKYSPWTGLPDGRSILIV
ncbi:hypothetical protein FB45DRAFT_909369, partial [Roridomyces roridus]